MRFSDHNLGFIGFGHIAEVIFRGVEKSKLIPRSQIFFTRRDPSKIKRAEMEFGITSTSLENLVKTCSILILAVRPNQAKEALSHLAKLKMDPTKICISVIAGINLKYFQKYSKNFTERVMPNVASEVHEGMSVIAHSKEASSEARSITRLLFSCLGQVIEVDEPLMDISCGIAGSGPGFVLSLIQAMSRVGVKHGLSETQATKMAAQTFLGAAKLILEGNNPQKLIDRLEAPNGTTAAGLKMLRSFEMETHFEKVIEAAFKRSEDLSQEFLE